MSEPENLVLKLLRDIRGEITDIHKQMATKNDVADVRSEVKSLRADVASDMINLEKRLGDRITHLNRAVVEYHSSAVGHGILISEFEDRLRRVEQHLNLPPVESY
jgi:uncharacterized coiled-coil DUF342 family protein